MADNQTDEQNQTAEIAELKDKYLRALADYQNLQKQTEVWKNDFLSFASENLVKKLLEVLDDLERAQETIQNDGLLLVITKFKKILASEGLDELKLEGENFDPALAEAVGAEEEKTDNVVIKVLQTGYKLGSKVIRPGKVIVSSLGKAS